MSQHPFMQYETDGSLTARWHGGEYIELGSIDPTNDGEFVAYDVINVWDYEAGTPRIDRTLDAFKARVDEFIAAQEREGQDYVTTYGDTFAGEPIDAGTQMRWDPTAGTHYPDGQA